MMKLEQYIALHLAFIVCLSSYMLGMGQGDVVLPILTLIAASVSLWVTDFQKWFFIGPILSNVLILVILLASVGYLIQAFDATFGGSLFSIAILRVLVFFQWVLLFRKKENRVCWNIMSVSFLEVIVATVFQQTAVFGLFVVLYLFAGLTVVTLMHLNRDRIHFTQHIFLRSLFRVKWKEKVSSGKTSPVRETPSRWPLANEKASFSGSAANLGGMIGIGREFYYRLVVTTIASLVVGLLIFFLTPRQDFRISSLEMQRENWRSPAAAGFLNAVGFAQEIRLGSLGTVLDNPTEIMNVTFSQLEDDAPPEASGETEYTAISNRSVYFRGLALQNYARGRWSSDDLRHYPNQVVRGPLGSNPSPGIPMFQDSVDFPIDSVVVTSQLPAAVPLPQERAELRFQPGTQLVYVQCDYLAEAQETFFAVWPYFFLNTRAGGRVSFVQDRIVRPQTYNSRRNPAFRFLTYSFRHGDQLDLIPCQEPVDLHSLLAFDDAALPTVAQTAQQWDISTRDRGLIERAKNLENRLMSDERFYYALGGIARSATLDPLEDFVRDHPGGHCEYFAGALAMMLRKIGIPVRVIVGYRLDTDAGNQVKGRYVVRESDAHSWVEAYIPPHEIPESLRNGPHADWWGRGGWLRLDPTAPLRDVMAQTGFWASLKYRATSFWNDYVINFNAARQEGAIYLPVADFFTSMKARFFDAQYWKTIGRAVQHRYVEIFRSLRQGNWQGNDLVLLGIPIVLVVAIGYVVYRVVRRVIREVHGRRLIREQRQRLVTVEFYRRFERIMQKLNLTRVSTETQREFARRCVPEFVPMADLPVHVAETFYRVRYGNITLTPGEADEIHAILTRLETVVPV
ncbi:MAG: transglutaminaseTgpA domain-containing protein [Planctomycetaceae bacterium]|nr:transglutaminaseTgpA domain-containing protein [Planctomycetaceae bacterium]